MSASRFVFVAPPVVTAMSVGPEMPRGRETSIVAAGEREPTGVCRPLLRTTAMAGIFRPARHRTRTQQHRNPDRAGGGSAFTVRTLWRSAGLLVSRRKSVVCDRWGVGLSCWNGRKKPRRGPTDAAHVRCALSPYAVSTYLPFIYKPWCARGTNDIHASVLVVLYCVDLWARKNRPSTS